MLWQIFQDNKENSVLPMTHEGIWITEISLNLLREGWSNKIVSMSMDFMAYSLEKWPTEMCLFHHYCYSSNNIVTGHQNCPYHLWEDSEFFTHLVDKKLLFFIIIFFKCNPDLNLPLETINSSKDKYFKHFLNRHMSKTQFRQYGHETCLKLNF